MNILQAASRVLRVKEKKMSYFEMRMANPVGGLGKWSKVKNEVFSVINAVIDKEEQNSKDKRNNKDDIESAMNYINEYTNSFPYDVAKRISDYVAQQKIYMSVLLAYAIILWAQRNPKNWNKLNPVLDGVTGTDYYLFIQSIKIAVNSKPPKTKENIQMMLKENYKERLAHPEFLF